MFKTMWIPNKKWNVSLFFPLLFSGSCPGAAMILFLFPNGTNMLHTGDFRADPSMERCPFLVGQKVHTVYLDTT